MIGTGRRESFWRGEAQAGVAGKAGVAEMAGKADKAEVTVIAETAEVAVTIPL